MPTRVPSAAHCGIPFVRRSIRGLNQRSWRRAAGTGRRQRFFWIQNILFVEYCCCCSCEGLTSLAGAEAAVPGGVHLRSIRHKEPLMSPGPVRAEDVFAAALALTDRAARADLLDRE